jgi:hypothetical protein
LILAIISVTMGEKNAAEQQKTALQYARAWGGMHSNPLAQYGQSLTMFPAENSFMSTLTAIPIFALHARPMQPLPLLFSPALLFASYVSAAGFKKDGAAMTASWSALYMILAMRRKHVRIHSGRLAIDVAVAEPLKHRLT